jgi:uncharacterized protein involved in exopolysaccharide biosynthesis
MHDARYSGPAMAPPNPQGPRRIWVIVTIVVVALCCACVVAAVLAWQYGDLVLEMLGITL